MAKLNNTIDIRNFFTYSLRDLFRSYRKIFSIIITLFVSLFILASIFTIEDSIKKTLSENSKFLLGGDIEVDFNKSKGDLDLINELKKISIVSRVVEFNTMISSTDNNKTSFTKIKSIDENYPLFGKVIFTPQGSLKKLNEFQNTIMVNKNIFKNFNLKLNDIIKLQDKEFKVIGVVESLPDIGGAFAFGDFALTGKKTLENLKLNNLGAFLKYKYKAKFKEPYDQVQSFQKVKKIFKNNKKVKLKYPDDSASGIKRFINNFSQFLSLVSISAMLIAGIGISNTLLFFLNEKQESIAVQKAVGFLSGQIKIIYYFELLIILILLSLLSYSLSFLLIPILNLYIPSGLAFTIDPNFSIYNLFKIFLIGFLIIIIFSIPTINSIDNVKASSLFRNIFKTLHVKYCKSSFFLTLILLLSLIALFSFDTTKPMYSLLYFLFYFFCLFVFYCMSFFIIFILKNYSFKKNLFFKIAIKNIIQSKILTHITIISLGLGSTLLLSLAFVGSNFKREISNVIPEIAPDYFFVGLQQNQKIKFRKYIHKSDPNSHVEIVPMVSASLLKINGINPNEYIKKSNNSHWFIRNERRLSWSKEIPEENTLVKGNWWNLTRPNKLQISLDNNIAKDFEVKVGDKFTLNIFGREITGEVVNLRHIDYSNLKINFAILINPQFAENLPHEYLSTVKFNKKNDFNNINFLNFFPSVSVIKISDYLSKVSEILNKVFIAVGLISIVAILIGLLVISSSIIVQGKIQTFQNLIFKILGLSKKEIMLSSILEFMITFITTTLFSTIFSIMASKYIIEKIFQLNWKFNMIIYLNVIIVIALLTLFLIILSNYRYLNPKVYPLVRNE